MTELSFGHRPSCLKCFWNISTTSSHTDSSTTVLDMKIVSPSNCTRSYTLVPNIQAVVYLIFFVFVLSHSVFSRCPAHLACWNSFQWNLITSNWETPHLAVKVLVVFQKFSSVSLSRSVHPSLFLLISFPERLSLLLFCFFVWLFCPYLYTQLALSFFLFDRPTLWPEGKTCKGIDNRHSQSTHGEI